MKKLLLVVSYYAPLNMSGVLRAVKFSQYLPTFGWEVHVLRPHPYLKLLYRDQTFPIPENVYVHTALHLAPLEFGLAILDRVGISPLWLVSPDRMRTWEFFAARKGVHVVEQEGIDAIMTTVPQFTAALAAAAIARQTGRPLLYDVRDSWNRESELHPMPTRWHARYNRALERSVVQSARMVTSVREVLVEQYRQDYPQADVRFLPHGVDENDIPPATTLAPPPRLHLLHLGTFYWGSNNRHPDKLYQAVRSLLDAGHIVPEGLKITFVGSTSGVAEQLAKAYGLEPYIICYPHQPYRMATHQMYDADVLFMVERTTSIPNKFYEYLATGLPALIMSANAEVDRIVHEYTDNSYTVQPDDVSAIQTALLRLVTERHLNSRLDSYRSQYSRKAQAQKLAQFLDEITS